MRGKRRNSSFKTVNIAVITSLIIFEIVLLPSLNVRAKDSCDSPVEKYMKKFS